MPKPVLRFTPYAWAKLLYLRDLGPTEIGAYAISNEKDPLLVEDLTLVKQKCTAVSTDFDGDGIADYFDDQVALGRKPEQFARIWVHTHPWNSADPSNQDETTFVDSFSGPHWAVMAILAKGGDTYARLKFNYGPGGEIEIPMRVAFDCGFPAVDAGTVADWQAEYKSKVDVEHDRWKQTKPGHYVLKQPQTNGNGKKQKQTQPRFAPQDTLKPYKIKLASGREYDLKAVNYMIAVDIAKEMDAQADARESGTAAVVVTPTGSHLEPVKPAEAPQGQQTLLNGKSAGPLGMPCDDDDDYALAYDDDFDRATDYAEFARLQSEEEEKLLEEQMLLDAEWDLEQSRASGVDNLGFAEDSNPYNDRDNYYQTLDRRPIDNADII
jgi:hypothetical protein